MSPYHHDLLPDQLYHVYTRAVGSEKLFLCWENYRFFLSKLRKYILPIAEVHSWTLLPNHFHFVLRIRSLGEIHQHYKSLKKNKELFDNGVSAFLMKCFSNLLNSYTKSFNKVYDRKGALFIDFMRRIQVKDETQYGATVFYVHKNAVHHGYCNTMSEWPWSSYISYATNTQTEFTSAEVTEWFGGNAAFMKYHAQEIKLKGPVMIEDL